MSVPPSMPDPSPRRPARPHPGRLPGVVLACAIAATLAACSSGDDGPAAVSAGAATAAPLASAPATVAQGATLVSPDRSIRVTIPPNAVSADTTATLERVAPGGPEPEAPLAAAGDAFVVRLANGATLTAPMRVEIASGAAPAHPALREVAMLVDGRWQRAPASFHRGTDGTTIALVRTAGTLRAIDRRLQATSGDAVARGRATFMDATFGNESFFGGVLGLHTLLNGLTPAQAVAAGVQVDLDRVPQAIAAVLTGGDLAAKGGALQDPAVTRALLKAGAVVGVRTQYANPASDMASSAGITCALCHVKVAPTTFQLAGGPTPLPIGKVQVDGVPNLAMDAGAILSLTPFAQSDPNVAALLASWGPGRFDVRALPDNPLDDATNNPTKTPPLWNFVDLAQQDYRYNWDGLFRNGAAGDALASQAEAVYDLVMHANGAFGTPSGSIPPELVAAPPPALVSALVAAETGAAGNVIPAAALRDVQAFQRSIVSPAPGAFDVAQAEAGFDLFNGKAGCAGCHRSAEFTGPVVTTRITLRAPQGGLAGGIKTPGLRGIARTAPYFHDGSAPTLMDVMNVYAGRVTPALSDTEKRQVVEYLKSL